MRRRAGVNSNDLSEYMLALGRADVVGDAVSVALRHSVELLGATFGRLVIQGSTTGACWAYSGESVSARPLGAFEAGLHGASLDSPGRAVHHSFVGPEGNPGQALVVQSPREDSGHLLLAVGKWDRRRFDDQGASLMDSLFTAADVALRNMELVDGLRQKAEELEHLATHDPLTGLANRLRFHSEAERALEGGELGAVLLIDLDRFKDVNDTLGHHIGDQLLVEVAHRITEAVGSGGLVARLGGDEFAVLTRQRGTAEVVVLAQELHRALECPVDVHDFEVDVGASIGVAVQTSHHESVGALLREADVAMYAAKEAHTPIEVYAPELDHYRPENLTLVPRFRFAVEAGDIHVAFQPQFDMHTGRTIGAEALARWSITGSGPVSPGEFIPIAESTGLIHPLTDQVLHEAIAQCASWQAGADAPRVSVNVSPRVLLEPGLADRISELLDHARLAPDRLRIEVTETTVMTDPKRAVAALHRLVERGVTVAIDDFGTGHSSLAYLTELPCDEIKIDRAFVAALEAHDARATAVISSVIGLGRDLGLDVIAEGVETQYAADRLRDLGCSLVQGFLYGRPVTASAFSSNLRHGHRWSAVTAAVRPQDRDGNLLTGLPYAVAGR